MSSYTVDTNIIVNMNRYTPGDIHVGLWSAVEEMISSGRLVLPREAYEELLSVDDVCGPWAKGCAGFIAEPTPEEFEIVAKITDKYPGWVTPIQNRADPFIIAHAKVTGRSILTEERAKGPGVIDANLKIPNVATEFGVKCLGFVELARLEGWVFQ